MRISDWSSDVCSSDLKWRAAERTSISALPSIGTFCATNCRVSSARQRIFSTPRPRRAPAVVRFLCSPPLRTISVVSLASVTDRFLTNIEVIVGGSGIIRGVITETDQNQVPSYILVSPRHVMRTRHPSAVRLGMVVRTQNGEVFIVGDNGPGGRKGKSLN